MVELVLSIINEALPLLDKFVPDQATKIRNQVLQLRGDWDAEISKGDKRDDAYLDSLELRLRDISELFTTAIKQATFKDKS